MKPMPIPKVEQLQALASSLADVYRLVQEYLGDRIQAPDYRKAITVTQQELAAYLAEHIELAERHLSLPTDPKFHENPVLERTKTGYRVYEVDHGRPRDVREFADLAEAAAEYLMSDW